MPSRPGRQMVRMGRRGLPKALALAAALLALALADRAGLFGANQDDLARYDGRSFEVVHHVDGDTFDLGVRDTRNGYATTRVRLWGVDTPETKRPDTPVQHFGPEASAFTERATKERAVRVELLEHRTRDRHGRLLAYVTLPDGRQLNRLLVEEGYAYADPRFEHPRRRDYAEAMTRARQARRGLWRQLRPSDLPGYLPQTLATGPEAIK